MDKISVRKPRLDDFGEAMVDMVSLRGLPPLLVSASVLVLLTGNLITASLGTLVTSYASSFWNRLL